MLCNILKLTVTVTLLALIVGCQSKNTSPSSSTVEELRLLSPEQEKKLLENAERVEKKAPETHPLKNPKGEVIGTITSETTIIFLKPNFGGGKFSVNNQCVSTCKGKVNAIGCSCLAGCTECGGTPRDLDPGQDDNSCSGTCTLTKTGFGSSGIFMAMDSSKPPITGIALK